MYANNMCIIVEPHIVVSNDYFQKVYWNQYAMQYFSPSFICATLLDVSCFWAGLIWDQHKKKKKKKDYLHLPLLRLSGIRKKKKNLGPTTFDLPASCDAQGFLKSDCLLYCLWARFRMWGLKCFVCDDWVLRLVAMQ